MWRRKIAQPGVPRPLPVHASSTNLSTIGLTTHKRPADANWYYRSNILDCHIFTNSMNGNDCFLPALEVSTETHITCREVVLDVPIRYFSVFSVTLRLEKSLSIYKNERIKCFEKFSKAMIRIKDTQSPRYQGINFWLGPNLFPCPLCSKWKVRKEKAKVKIEKQKGKAGK
jgi:hypothetical protein